MKRLKNVLIICLAAIMMIFAGTEVFAAQTAEDTPRINYTVVGSSRITTPQTQTVVVSIGEIGSNQLSSAVLTYKNSRTGEVYTVNAEKIYEDAALFSMRYEDFTWNGVYELTELSCVYAGKEVKLTYDRNDTRIRFGVNEAVNTNPDDVLVDEDAIKVTEDISAEIVSVDAAGGMKESDLASAIADASRGRSVSGSDDDIDSTGASGLVVVLDPGHGGKDSGAAGNGLYEKNLTLKIGKYCKEELEKYSGVKVYMTRANDTYLTIDQRIAYATSVKADVFVSLHINSAANTSANGAEVYYPNSNYKPSYGKEGKELADEIQKKLTALGLNDRGIKILNSQTGDTYADGSLADYYGVIRGAKKAGYPGIIVEHAFISNAADAKNYLGSDSVLKKLGVADAQGIAAHYGLKKKSSSSLSKTSISQLVGKSSSCVYLKWKKVSGASGYEIYRSTSKNGTYKKIKTISKGSTVSYKDKSVKGNKTYYYKVRPYKNSGDKKETAGFCMVQKVKVLKKPAISSVKASSGSQLKISWKKVSSAGKYEIYRSTSRNGTYRKVAAVKKNVTSYKDKKLKANKTYYYKIRAVGTGVNGNTYSSYSAVKSGKTKK